MAGKPLAGTSGNGFIGILWKIIGDLNFFSDDLYLPRFNTAKPCALCPAESCLASAMPWDDFRAEAECFQHTYTNQTFRLLFVAAHQLFSCQPGVGICTLSPDYMHDKHLGFDKYFLASVLVVIVFRIMEGTPEANLAILWNDICDYYRSTQGKKYAGKSYRNMYFQMFCNRGDLNETQPQMKGRAAEIRSLTPALNAIFPKYAVRRNALHKSVRLALQFSSRMDEILAENKNEDCLPGPAAMEFQKCTFDLLAATKFCCAEAAACDPPIRAFNLTIKSHYLCHIALQAPWINPRHGWCYAGEDLMHKMKLLAATCCRARSPYTVFDKMNAKYLFALHHEFTRGRLAVHGC